MMFVENGEKNFKDNNTHFLISSAEKVFFSVFFVDLEEL